MNFLLNQFENNGQKRTQIAFKDFQKSLAKLLDCGKTGSSMGPILPGSAANFNPFKLRAKLGEYRKIRQQNMRKFELNSTGSNNCKSNETFRERTGSSTLLLTRTLSGISNPNAVRCSFQNSSDFHEMESILRLPRNFKEKNALKSEFNKKTGKICENWENGETEAVA